METVDCRSQRPRRPLPKPVNVSTDQYCYQVDNSDILRIQIIYDKCETDIK